MDRLTNPPRDPTRSARGGPAADRAALEAAEQQRVEKLSLEGATLAAREITNRLNTNLIPAVFTLTVLQRSPDLPPAQRELIDSIMGNLRTVADDIRQFQKPATLSAMMTVLRRREATRRGGSTDKVIEELAGIDAAVLRIAGLLDEVRDEIRLQVGRPLDLELAPVDLIELTRRVVADAQDYTTRHQIRVRATEAELVGVWDPTRLELVLRHLLRNAIAYSPNGGKIEITVERRDQGGTWATVAIRDQGTGIPESELPHIFEWYYRGSQVVDRYPGDGLGLPSAREIVDQHGGTITVSSREGAGSTFTVHLPLSARA